jgi:hypothetical protein
MVCQLYIRSFPTPLRTTNVFQPGAPRRFVAAPAAACQPFPSFPAAWAAGRTPRGPSSAAASEPFLSFPAVCTPGVAILAILA